GMCLVTGITGSGKSSTLDAVIDANNHTVDAHVVIIASPIEYVHKSDRCIIRHREVGRDVMSYKEGAVQALRQDPDIIMIGELRDPETIMTALEITDSGHKVFSTLHTSSAVESIDRIIGETNVNEQERVRNRLADVIRCVISQKLVPSVDGKRVLCKEVMIASPSVRAAIKNNNTGEIYQMMSESGNDGMLTMEQDLKRLFLQRKITLETAINFSNNKRRLQQILNIVPQGD
ncbi:MAG: Flp pilus assembly complex ATPase component TadA, partial [Ignavibacteriales bacterium]|nr:Flp pilus assembly complex ATPase component TadA [Ignavibacteriales bacterium]